MRCQPANELKECQLGKSAVTALIIFAIINKIEHSGFLQPPIEKKKLTEEGILLK